MFARLFRGDKPKMTRWAVLWDVLDEVPKPVGLAVEHPGHVHVFAPQRYHAPTRFSGEYQVLQPDGSLVTYRPGMDGYFDQVLVDLARSFGVGEQGVAPELDRAALMHLFVSEVARPYRRAAAERGHYAPPEPAQVPNGAGWAAPTYRPRRRRPRTGSRDGTLAVA